MSKINPSHKNENLSKIAFAIMLSIGIISLGAMIAVILFISISSPFAEIIAASTILISIIFALFQSKQALKTNLSIGNMEKVYSCNYEIGSNL